MKMKSIAKVDLTPEGWGKRHTFTLLSFLGFVNVFAMRVNLSVAIIKMVNSTEANSSASNNRSTDVCYNFGNSEEIDTMASNQATEGGEFNWNAREQGQLLGSLFYGNFISQIPAGILAELVGGKLIFSLGILCSSIITLLTPWLAYQSFFSLIVSRALIGFAQGATFPSMYVLIAQWIPPRERSKMASVIWSGIQFGTFVEMALSGFLIDLMGWQFIFYFNGCCGILWFLLFFFLCSDKPSLHKTISSVNSKITKSTNNSQEELFYIENSFPESDAGKAKPKKKFPPIKEMLVCRPVLSLIVTHAGNNWGMYTLLTQMPKFLSSVHYFNLTSSGLYSALPYFLMWCFTIFCGNLASYLSISRQVRSEVIRKVFNTVGHVGPALGLFGLSFSGCHHVMVIIFFCLAVMFNGAAMCGFQVNHVELSPNYAGTLMGVTNTAANVAAFAAPYVIGLIMQGGETLQSWQIVFWIAATIYIIDSCIFVLLGTSKCQSWNDDLKDSDSSYLSQVSTSSASSF